MEYKLKGDDYLDLWKYFQDKATSVKGAMFNTITWIIGFAAALLAFIFANLTDYDSSKAAISLSMLVILASIAGLVICLYAFFALGESAKHINNNWDNADRCFHNIAGLREIVFPEGEEKKESVVKIWNQLRIVVFLFSAAFVGILVWASKI